MPFCFSVRFSLPVTNLNGSSDLVALEDQADEGGYVEILAILTLQPHTLLVFPRDTKFKYLRKIMKIYKYDASKKKKVVLNAARAFKHRGGVPNNA